MSLMATAVCAAVGVWDSLETTSAKKTDVAEHPEAFRHVGLLVNEPPGHPGCSLGSHPKTLRQNVGRCARLTTP